MTWNVSGWLIDWADTSVRRKITIVLTAGLAFASLCFLVLIVAFYRNRVMEERGMASVEINRLLQVTLENAMLKRDIDGLADIVKRLGQQERIVEVMILSPNGEVRFASEATRVGKRFDLVRGDLCPGCQLPNPPNLTYSAFLTDATRGEVLRSINPVPNRTPCTQCHGAISENPLNGVLVVDYDARQILRDTMLATLTLSGAGLTVLLAAIGGIGWMLNHRVLRPMASLSDAATAIAQGRLSTRIAASGNDEIAKLAVTFNTMAERVERSMHDVEAREHYLQAIIDAMPDGVRVIDSSFKVVNANAAFAAHSGRTVAEIVGAPCYLSSHNRTEPCPPTLLTCPLVELKHANSPLICRQRHTRADGTEIQVEVSAASLDIKGADGVHRRLIVEVSRDLSTDLKLSQEQRLSELGFIAAGVAHEIHNPLASIQFSLAALGRAWNSGRSAEMLDYVRVIEGEISRCINITSRLLKLSASADQQRELVALDEVIADILSLLKTEALKTGTEFFIEMPTNLRVIASDSDLRMLVLNLAQNALHAMPHGGRLSITARLSEFDIIVTFADTGVGIAAENLSRIFDPF